MEIIRISDIHVALSSATHRDIPENSKLSVQIIIDDFVFLQTFPVDGIDSKRDCWRFKLDCNIFPSVRNFSIAVLRETTPRIPRLLGIIGLERGNLLEKAECEQHTELTLSVVQVNDDGPPLVLTIEFMALSHMPPFHSQDVQIHVYDNFRDPALSLKAQLEPIRVHLDQMEKASMSGKQIDPLELSLIHERILLLSCDSSTKAKLLNTLGDVCSKQNESNDVDDLRRAVGCYDDAIRVAHSEIGYYNDLGLSLLNLFNQLGEIADLDWCIRVFQSAILRAQDRHPDKHILFSNLGISLTRRFQHLGELPDLERSIQAGQEAILFTPEGAPDPALLTNLGMSLLNSFLLRGNISDLNRSIQINQEAVLLTPDGDPDKPACLDNLGLSLLRRFERLGDNSDLDESVKAHQEAVLLALDEHPAKCKHLANLGISLMRRFESRGELSDINSSIQVIQKAVLLTPAGHPDKPGYLMDLGLSHLRRFTHLGDHSDLDRSIKIYQDAVLLTPDGHIEKPRRINNLGNILRCSFKHRGELSDLNKSIKVLQDVILLISDGHTAKPTCLNNLGISLMDRFEHLGDLPDLERSIRVQKDAVLLTPDGHPDKPRHLSTLGSSLILRYVQFETLSDLNESVKLLENAVLLMPHGHPDKPIYLSSLGCSLTLRFEQLEDLSDLTKSIHVLEEAVLLTPEGHPAMFSCLDNLGASLQVSFERLKDVSALNKSIEVHQRAVILTPDEHPGKAKCFSNLAKAFHTRFKHQNNPEDILAAISNYALGAQTITASSRTRFISARCWMRDACQHLPDHAFLACTAAVNLIPQLTWLGSSIRDRYQEVTAAGGVARDAAAVAIINGKYDTAVEWLEQGRLVIWNQLYQLRSPIEELHRADPQAATRLQTLSAQLEGSTSSDMFEVSQQRVDYHALAQEREDQLKQIRKLPGFDRFLLPVKLSQLLPAANGGAIVMVNVSNTRCDALVLIPGRGDVCHVPLKNITYLDTSAWLLCIQSILDNPTPSLSDFRTRLKGLRVPDPDMGFDRESVLESVLYNLWDCVAKPILDAIAITEPMTSSNSRRIWWCLTGPLALLPIHAAGVYPEGPKLSDFVISSYTPSLNALIKTPVVRPGTHQLLAIALPNESRLPGTAKEISIIETVIKQSNRFDVVCLLEGEATQQRVSEAMKTSSWVHFACHGLQDISNPTESHLQLAHRSKLTLSQIIKHRLENAEFAFLSACQTATGSEELLDEAVHLAAGMLLAGYRSVIATMWTVDDDIATDVAGEVYRHLFFDEYDVDYTRSAEALHFAVKRVCETRRAEGKSVSLFSWVPFIHNGL